MSAFKGLEGTSSEAIALPVATRLAIRRTAARNAILIFIFLSLSLSSKCWQTRCQRVSHKEMSHSSAGFYAVPLRLQPAARICLELLPVRTPLLAASNAEQDELRGPVTNCRRAMRRPRRSPLLRVTNCIATVTVRRRRRVCSSSLIVRLRCIEPSSPNEEEPHARIVELAGPQGVYVWTPCSQLKPTRSRARVVNAQLRPPGLGPDLRFDRRGLK